MKQRGPLGPRTRLLAVANPSPPPTLQDPSSHHLGTTVWDASLVFAHWAAQRQGDFARVRGKRVLELGAGAGGVAGMALALLGAHVTLTDVNEVLPLLRANVANNISPAALRGGPGAALLLEMLLLLLLLMMMMTLLCCSQGRRIGGEGRDCDRGGPGLVGRACFMVISLTTIRLHNRKCVDLAALPGGLWHCPAVALPSPQRPAQRWGSAPSPLPSASPADCVYSEPILPHFLKTVLHFAGPRTTVCITNEFRYAYEVRCMPTVVSFLCR